MAGNRDMMEQHWFGSQRARVGCFGISCDEALSMGWLEVSSVNEEDFTVFSVFFFSSKTLGLFGSRVFSVMGYVRFCVTGTLELLY